jgi:hypothetical protein
VGIEQQPREWLWGAMAIQELSIGCWRGGTVDGVLGLAHHCHIHSGPHTLATLPHAHMLNRDLPVLPTSRSLSRAHPHTAHQSWHGATRCANASRSMPCSCCQPSHRPAHGVSSIDAFFPPLVSSQVKSSHSRFFSPTGVPVSWNRLF